MGSQQGWKVTALQLPSRLLDLATDLLPPCLQSQAGATQVTEVEGVQDLT